jgi:hypothetical protein
MVFNLEVVRRASTKQDCFVGSEEKMAKLRITYREGLGAFR